MYTITELQAWLQAQYSRPIIALQSFSYPITFLALAQNANATQQLTMQANADFCCLNISHRAQIGAAQVVDTKTAPFVRMLVTDSGSNQQWTNQAIDLENYSTNDAKMRPLPFPRIVQGRSALTIAVTNYAPTAETYTTLDIAFGGVLIYT